MALIDSFIENPTTITVENLNDLKDALVDGTLEINTSGIRIGGTTYTIPNISSGSGAPGSTPSKVGDLYIDTSGNAAYIATGTSSSGDWEQIDVAGGGGGGTTEEQVEDWVGGMLSGTQTLISVSYDDVNGELDFVVDNDLSNYDNSTSGFITATLTDEEVEDIVGGMVSGNTEARITVSYSDATGKLNFTVDDDLSNYDNTTSGFITATLTDEEVQDIVGGMLSGNTETLITVTYQDGDGTIDFVVDDDLSLYDNTTSGFITSTLSSALNVSDNDIQNIKLAEFQDEHDNGNSGTSDTINWGNGNNQKSTLTGNCTFTFTAPSGPARLQLRLIQDGTGSRTVTWPTIQWAGGSAPTLSTAASAVDIVTLWYDGTNYYGVSSLNFS